MYTIQQIANRLTELVSKQKFVAAYEQLYAQDAESIDPLNKEQATMKGLSKLIEREKDFLSRTEIHKITLSQPLIAGCYFTVSLSMSFTIANQDKMDINELCVYKVKDGRSLVNSFL